MKMKSRIINQVLSLVVLLGSLTTSEAHAGERKTSLDFEEQLVEGVNKRPLDSLNSVNDGNGAGKNRHLYSRKIRFEAENRRLLQDAARYSTQR